MQDFVPAARRDQRDRQTQKLSYARHPLTYQSMVMLAERSRSSRQQLIPDNDST